MNDLWFRLLLGHCVGDYLLQNDWMSLNKKKRWLPLFVHCTLYTIAVCAFLWDDLMTYGVLTKAIIVIFGSHIIFDGTKIIDKWLAFIGSRSWDKVAIHDRDTWHWQGQMYGMYTAIVQTVADNTAHLVLMYWGLKSLLRF